MSFNAHQEGFHFSWALHLIMTYQRPQIPNYKWGSPVSHPAPQHVNHLISISHHKKEYSLTASDSSLSVTGALRGRKNVFLQAICGWVMTRVYYGLICHYQTLAFWLWKRTERWRDGCQLWRVKTRMKDDGAGESVWKDEEVQRGKERLGSVENLKLSRFLAVGPKCRQQGIIQNVLYLRDHNTWVVPHTFLNSSQ